MWIKFNRILGIAARSGLVEGSGSCTRATPALNSYWSPRLKWCFDVLDQKPANGGPDQITLLVDEPDRSLDLQKQEYLWAFLRSIVAPGKVQVIVASHSIFALDLPEAHYIETVPNACSSLKEALTKGGYAPRVTPAVRSAHEFVTPTEVAAVKKKRRSIRAKT